MNFDIRILLSAVLLAVAGCATSGGREGPQAVSTLEGRSGSNAFGVVTFVERADGSVKIRADLSNVPPGLHGFHIHETGNCSAPDASSAGGHFNPAGVPHAGPGEMTHHAGDLGNVEANASGRVYMEITSDDLSVSQGPNSVVGKAIVLHAEPDDMTSQPSGAAGARIACGVINLSPQ